MTTDSAPTTTRPGPTDNQEGAGRQFADERGRRLYDRWSEHGLLYGSVMWLASPLRARAFEALAAEPGERVLDLACGPGINFERLRDDVGPDGSVVGLDYSEGMVRRARQRVDDGDWANVEVVRADARRPFGMDGEFDAAFTTMALHTMADAETVVANVREVLRPGGRLVVLDGRALQAWPATLLNPLFERVMAATVNHRPDEDPLGALRATFETVEVVETFDLGSGFVAVATKAAGED